MAGLLFRGGIFPRFDFKGILLMAQKIVVQLIDDLDGSPIEGNGATVAFALEGVSYEIELTHENRERLREVLAPYIRAGRKASSGPARRSPRRAGGGAPSEAGAIREWAKANGLEVSERGRVPADIVAAYHAR